MSQDTEKFSLRETLRMLRRCFATARRMVPGLMLSTVMRSFSDSMLPLATAFFTSRILNELLGKRDPHTLLQWVALTLAVGTGLFLLRRGMEILWQISRIGGWLRERIELSDVIMGVPFELLEDAHFQDKQRNYQNFTRMNGTLFISMANWLEPLSGGIFTVVGSLALVFSLFFTPAASHWIDHPALSAGVIVLILLAAFLSGRLQNKKQTKSQQNLLNLIEADKPFFYYLDKAGDYRNGKEIRLYREQEYLLEKARGTLRKQGKANPYHAYANVSAWYEGAVAVVSSGLSWLVYLYIGMKGLLGSIAAGNIVQYVAAIHQFSQGIIQIAQGGAAMLAHLRQAHMYFDIVDTPNDKANGTLGVDKATDARLEIEFHDVSFRYPGAQQYALRHLNLRFHVGERLAVVGMNGSGKTTMIKLLCRLYDPTEGSITLNGKDIREYKEDEYWSIFSVVFQDFRLFPFALGQNVAASAGLDAELAQDSLRRAGLDLAQEQFQQGLDTLLYKNFNPQGVEISGGEAQKIALARALYKNAPFVVLDEPTAALDPIAEFDIYSRFNDLVSNRTAIFISHRLSSCRFCHDIAVFHEGQLIQRGSHEELIAQTGGKYFELWNAQAQYYV